MSRCRRSRGAALSAFLIGLAVSPASGVVQTGPVGASDAELERAAERRFRSAEQFYAGGRYAQALRDFEAILTSMPGSRLADDAALRIARHRFEVEGDPAAAEEIVERLFRDYPAGDAIPGAHLLLGRIAAGSVPPRPADALAEFERALTTAPPAGAPSSFAALIGIARLSGDLMDDEVAAGALLSALHETGAAANTVRERFEARFALARTLARLGESDAALAQISSLRTDLMRAVREAAPESNQPSGFAPRRLAERATDLATLVMRYRGGSEPVWRFDGGSQPPRPLDEPRRIRIADGLFHLLDHDTGELQTFSPAGQFLGATRVEDPWDLAFAPPAGAQLATSTPVVATEEALVVDGNLLTLRVPSDGRGSGAEPLRRIRAVAVAPEGFWVWDDRRKAVFRFARSGMFLGRFPHARLDEVHRIGRHPAGHLVVIEDRQGVVAFDPAGDQVFHLSRENRLVEPVDFTFDDLGHLIILDRDGPTLAVHDRSLALVATLGGEEWSGGSVRRPISLDAAPDGGLVVLDGITRTVAILR